MIDELHQACSPSTHRADLPSDGAKNYKQLPVRPSERRGANEAEIFADAGYWIAMLNLR